MNVAAITTGTTNSTTSNTNEIRNRKKSQVQIQIQSKQQQTSTVSTVTESVLSSNTISNNTSTSTNTNTNTSTSTNNNTPFHIIPLIERSIVTRYDVGPFIILYILLIYIDTNIDQIQQLLLLFVSKYYSTSTSSTLLLLWNTSISIIEQYQSLSLSLSTTVVGPILLSIYTFIVSLSYRTIVSIVFVIVMIVHLLIILVCQWNVLFRCTVGYYKCNNIHETNSKRIVAWTHCYVSSISSGSDIVSITKSQCYTNSNSQSLIINFQQRIFRYYISSDNNDSTTNDDDYNIWNTITSTTTTTTKTSTTTDKKQQQTPSISLSYFRPLHYPIDMPLNFYTNIWKGHVTAIPTSTGTTSTGTTSTGTTSTTNTNTLTSIIGYKLYNTNTTTIQLPKFYSILLQQLIQPFFLFQLLCCILWSLDEYWYYSIFTLCALVLFECTICYNKLINLQRIQNISNNKNNKNKNTNTTNNNNNNTISVRRLVNQYTNTISWISIPVCELLPGDYINFGRSCNNITIPADILLLTGSVVCDEALLTGESIPQLKYSFDLSSYDTTSTTSNTSSSNNTTGTIPNFDMNNSDYKDSILYCGTTMLVGTSTTNSDDTNLNDALSLSPSSVKSTSSNGNSNLNNSNSNTNNTKFNGIEGIVLKTGFETTQGNLLRTMIYSTNNSSNGGTTTNNDTYVFILLLILCAIVAAMYVLYYSYNDTNRNTFRLLLHIIIIITSVVPPELPMELSLAVTNSVATLVRKCNVYCTEHYRIPYGGQITICCFDKTGTLTSDEMILIGVRTFNNNNNTTTTTTTTTNGTTDPKTIVTVDTRKEVTELPCTTSTSTTTEHTTTTTTTTHVIDLIKKYDNTTKKVSKKKSKQNDEEDIKMIRSIDDTNSITGSSFINVPWETRRIMASCHSLALTHPVSSSSSTISTSNSRNSNTTSNKNSVGPTIVGDPLERTVLLQSGYQLHHNNIVIPVVARKVTIDSSSSSSNEKNEIVENNTNNNNNSIDVAAPVDSILILHRFPFSSKLKRMTTIITEGKRQKKKDDSSRSQHGPVYAVTKGAPETIKTLLSIDTIPSDYDTVSYHHMKKGRRVLAMAYKELKGVTPTSVHSYIRDDEAGTSGRTKIENQLIFAGFLILECPLKSDTKVVLSEIKKSGHATVMITGDALLTATEVAKQVGMIPSSCENVYSIQSRSNKVKTIIGDKSTNSNISTKVKDIVDEVLSSFEYVPLGMPLDDNTREDQPTSYRGVKLSQKVIKEMIGRNDVAFCMSGDTLAAIATKAVVLEQQRKNKSIVSNIQIDEKTVLLNPISLSTLQCVVPIITVFARHAPHHKEAVIASLNNSGHITLMCGDGTNDVGALKRAHVGISLISAPEVESKQRIATQKINKATTNNSNNSTKTTKKNKKSTTTTTTTTSKASKSTIEESFRQLREAQDELDYVELGDASVAAPFTSRAVSIKCCKDVIQQGRCTLVTMLEIYKILGINCLVNALVLSRLFLYGVKHGDRQLTVLGLGVASLFYFVTRSEPLTVLSPLRPPVSVLCVQALLSIVVQFTIHATIIIITTHYALMFVDPYDPSLVLDGPFNPNVLNSCTFLLTCLATVNTFGVNYRGRPFMQDLTENTLLYRTLQVCYGILAICALNIFPPLGDLLQMSDFPTIDDMDPKQRALLPLFLQELDFNLCLSLVMIIDTIATYTIERQIRYWFEK